MISIAMVFTLLGWVGTLGLVGCHLLLSLKILKVGVLYQSMQVVFAGALGVSALWAQYYPTAFLEIFWAAVSVFAIRLYLMRGAKA